MTYTKEEKIYRAFLQGEGLLSEYDPEYTPSVFNSRDELLAHILETYCDQDMESTLQDCEWKNIETEGVTEDEIYQALSEHYLDEIESAPDTYGWQLFVRATDYKGKTYWLLCSMS